MAETNRIVDEVVIVARSEGVEKTTSDLDKLTAAENRSNAAGERTVAVQERSGRARLSVAGAVDRLARQMDQEYRMLRQVEQAQALLDRAFQQGLAGTTAYDRATAALAERQSRVAAAADEAAKATRRLGEAQRVQATVNGATGVRIDFGTAGRAADVAAYGAEMDRLRARFVPLFAAEKQHHDVLGEINAAARVGAISETERGEAVARATAAFTAHTATLRGATAANDNHAKSTGLAAHQLQNLGYQLNDVVTSLASGISPMQTFAQQGGQIVQVLSETGVSGAVRGVGQAVGRFITPATATIGALAAATVYAYTSWNRFDDETRRVGTTLQGLGRSTGLTRDSFEALAVSAAKAGDLTVRQAIDLGTALAATGQIGPENIGRLIAVSKDLAATFGTDLDGIKDKLASFGSVEGIVRLNAQLAFLDAKTQGTIESLFRQGKAQEAIALAIDRLPPALAKAESAQGALARGWDAIKSAISDADHAAGRFLDKLTDSRPEDRLKALKQRVEALSAAEAAAAEGLVQPGGTARSYTPPTAPTVSSTVAAPAAPTRTAELREARSELQKYMEQLAETQRIDEQFAQQKASIMKLNETSTALKGILRELHPGTEEYRVYTDYDKRLTEALSSGNTALAERLSKTKDYTELQSMLRHAIDTNTNAEGERMTAAEKGAERRRIEIEGVRATTVAGRARVAQMETEHRQRGQLIAGEDALAEAVHRGAMVREQADQHLRDMLRDQGLEAQDIRGRIGLIGQDAEARAVAIARRRAENDLLREGYDLQGGLAQRVIAGAEANARMGVSYDRAAEAQQRMIDGQRELGSEVAGFITDILAGAQKVGQAFDTLAKNLSSNVIRGLLTGEGPLAGILGTAPTERGRMGGILGGRLDFGGMFDSDKIADALGLGAETGLGKAVTAALKEQRTGGGFFSSQVGQGIAAVGAGASVGYASQSPLMGAASGALAGLATGNPLLAAAGPAIGMGGTFGKRRPAADVPHPDTQETPRDGDQRPLAA